MVLKVLELPGSFSFGQQLTVGSPIQPLIVFLAEIFLIFAPRISWVISSNAANTPM